MERTYKQWLAEQTQKVRAQAEELSKMSQDFPVNHPNQQMQTTDVLTRVLFERQSSMLQRLEELYDSAIRETVARMLSEFMTVATTLPNISARMQKWSHISRTLVDDKLLSMEDRWMVDAFVATVASGGNIEFTVRRSHKGLGISASKKGEQVLP